MTLMLTFLLLGLCCFTAAWHFYNKPKKIGTYSLKYENGPVPTFGLVAHLHSGDLETHFIAVKVFDGVGYFIGNGGEIVMSLCFDGHQGDRLLAELKAMEAIT
ncbi:hypothetical protein [Vibrio sp. PNB22_4_1]|uniref:hypothetical protein n=2 Tax=Vibrionaceae TaxID=641 RepID=UPI00406A9890